MSDPIATEAAAASPTFWAGTHPLFERQQALWQELVPPMGVALTAHGELLRAVGRIYYDRYNNGFGNGPFDNEFDTIITHGAALRTRLGDDYEAFLRAFEMVDKGGDVVDREWRGDALLERLVAAAVEVADEAQRNAPALPFRGRDELVRALTAHDPKAVECAAALLRHASDDVMAALVASQVRTPRAKLGLAA